MLITIGLVSLSILWILIISGLVKSRSDKDLWGRELEDE